MGFYARYAAFGAASPPIVGALEFQEQWSADDWAKNSWNPDYRPPDSEMLGQAQSKWQELTDARDGGSSTAGTILDLYSKSITNASAIIDSYTQAGYYGQGQPQAQNRINAFNSLSALMGQLAKVVVPDPEAEQAVIKAAQDAADAHAAAAAAATQAAASKTQAQVQGTQAAITAAKAAAAAAQQAAAVAQAHTQAAQQKAALVAAQQKSALTAAQGAATAAAASTSSTTPILLGLLGVAVLGAGFFALKHKKSAVAGYRKRRRR